MIRVLFVLLLVSCEHKEETTLDISDEGWENAECWSCHDPLSTHNSDLQPYQCADCHGDNGAPEGHSGDTPCSSCHDQPHAAEGFPDPDSCVICHGS